MPKATKDAKKEELEKKKPTEKKSSTTKKTEASKKKTTTASKSTQKTTKGRAKKEIVADVNKKEVKEKNNKKTTTTKKKSSTTTKKVSATTKRKTTSTTKKTSSRKKTTQKKLEENIVAEYYDLPYKYNETLVKILYQTPTILFVYWDISDYDRESYVKQYGEKFFNNTKPVLKIYNLTKDYSFEVEINDFANSWYINVSDANCKYKVKLTRKAIDYVENSNSEYIHISSSNDIEFPNDHILLEELPSKIRFKNVKTNQISTKDISTLHLIGINKIYKVHDFYNTFYKDELYEERIINPSSSWK